MPNSNNITNDWPPKMAVCVGTVVLKEGKALLVRQAKGHSLEGQWSIPWGVVDPGETPEFSALRETFEESGIRAVIKGLLGFQNLKEDWIGLVFLCKHVKGVPRSDGGIETDKAGYFSQSDLEKLDDPIEPWCEWVVKKVLRGNYHLIPLESENPYQPKKAFL